MKLAIITCANREPKWGYIQSMALLEKHLHNNGVCGKPVDQVNRMIMRNCSLLPTGRQRTLDMAIAEGYNHALMVDDDMEFPPGIVDRMMLSMSHDPIHGLGINYLRKGFPLHTAVGADGNILSSEGRTGIELVRTCGLGFFLLDLSVMKNVSRPHFEVLWNERGGGYEGEDCYFTKKLAAHGVPVYIDHDASKLVGHIGDYSYGTAAKEAARV